MCSRCSDSGLLAFPVESMFRLDTAERQGQMTARPIPGTRNIVRRLGTNDASGVIVGAPPTPLIARVPCDESARYRRPRCRVACLLITCGLRTVGGAVSAGDQA